MQGVPRYLIEERILTGATNYWAKIKSEQTQKPKTAKENKKIKKELAENQAKQDALANNDNMGKKKN